MFYTLIKHGFSTNRNAHSEHAHGPIYIITLNKIEREVLEAVLFGLN